MRSDRKKEIAAQMEAERRTEKRTKGNKFFRTVSIIYTLAAIAFVYMIWKLNMLPEKYFYGGVGVLALVSLFIVPVMFSKKGRRGRRIFASFIAVVMIGTFGVGTWYVADTLDFLGNITKITNKVVEKYDVVVAEGSTYKELKEIKGEVVGTYMSDDFVYSEAKAVLQEKVPVEYGYEENMDNMMFALKDGKYKVVFLSHIQYKNLLKEKKELSAGTKVLKTVEVEIEEKEHTSKVDVKKEAFNILISGIDARGAITGNTRTDVNMLATVNPVTHKVMLTSIPRDYYINLPSKKAKDKLTHSSLFGIQETVGAVEDLLGIDINYYVRVNYSTVTKLVDAIGGIDVNSPNDFSTSGMGLLNGHHFVKGINHLDGKGALAFSRERHSFVDGDLQRNENQQLVMKGIIEKATSSTTILTSYTDLLKAIKYNLKTNMSKDEMSIIIKEQLRNMPKWDIEKQAIRGTPGFDFCFALNTNASIVNQNLEANAKVVDGIVKTMTSDKINK